jgi:hypothetical protein
VWLWPGNLTREQGSVAGLERVGGTEGSKECGGRGVVATASHWAARAVPASPLSLWFDDGRGVTEAREGFPATGTRERGSDRAGSINESKRSQAAAM